MDENKTAAVFEMTERLNKSDRRSLMLISSAALQWVLILVCIVFLAVLYKGSHQQVPQTPKPFVIADLKNPHSTSQNCIIGELEKTDGNMMVENNTIVISSSGSYLVYLEGLTNDNGKPGEIVFHFKHAGWDKEKIWKENVLNGSIRATIFRKLYYDSTIYLTACALTFDELRLIVHPV